MKEDGQNGEASNLAQVLEVIWTKIGECIDDKKSLVLYFDGCTVRVQRVVLRLIQGGHIPLRA